NIMNLPAAGARFHRAVGQTKGLLLGCSVLPALNPTAPRSLAYGIRAPSFCLGRVGRARVRRGARRESGRMNAFLRSWRADDADALAEVYASADADLTGNIPDDRSLDGARAWIEQIHRAETAGTASAYVLVAEPERRIVGNVMASGIERRHSS